MEEGNADLWHQAHMCPPPPPQHGVSVAWLFWNYRPGWP